MKRESLLNFSKKIMAIGLSTAMILTGITIVPKTAKAATETAATVYFATTAEYKMSDYWSQSEKKTPVKAGYVFSGWYKTDATTPLKAAELEVADDTAIAKFVPAEVLSIKTQVGTDGTTTSLRILSTVDSTNYQEVGFEYKLAANDLGTTENITKVYSAIKPYKGASDEELQYPSQSFVQNVSKYFIAADVSSISSNSFSKIVYARPFWITMDGTKVMGLARNSRVEDKNNGYTSVGINLLPELLDGEYAAVAAGKIQVKYNTTNYDVVGTTADITYNATNGGKYLFTEMECHVDEAAGTITFVGNADDVTKNLTADGLFANVRFVKAEGATGTALDFEIKTDVTEFCNWAEESVEHFVVQ